MAKLKIKNGDTVQVITGDDKGKTGNVLKIDPFAMKLQVSGVRIQTKLNKREKTQYKEEGWLDYSNVKLASGAKKTTKKKATKKKASKKKTASADATA
jgi:large subunit ribosomal protein L24